MLATDEDYQSLIEVLDEGATGYLTKEVQLAELVDATRAVHRAKPSFLLACWVR